MFYLAIPPAFIFILYMSGHFVLATILSYALVGAAIYIVLGTMMAMTYEPNKVKKAKEFRQLAWASVFWPVGIPLFLIMAR